MGKNRKGNGQFAKGHKVNEKVKISNEHTDSMENAGQIMHKDGWFSLLTGLGTVAKDKRQSHDFCVDVIDYETSIALWRSDDIAAKAIDLPVDDMTRAGFDFQIQDDADNTKEKQEDLEQLWEDLEVIPAFHEALGFERAYGGSAILIGAKDFATDLALPLDIDRVQSVDFLTVLERRELVPMFYYANPRAPKYGQVAIYQLAPIGPGQDVNNDPAAHEIVLIHETRLIVFPGVRVTRQTLAGTDGWGDSIFNRMWSVLRDFNIAWDGTGILVSDFSQAVFKMKELAALLGTTGGEEKLAIRLRALDLGRSTARAVVIDEEEEFERKATPVTGLAELLREYMSRMAAAVDMPVTLLFGTSPAGLNATGESDIRLWYDRVASKQDRKVIPGLRYLTKILLAASENDFKRWSVVARPLWQPTDQEVAETRKTVAESDKIMIEMDVLTADDVVESRYGGDVWTMETIVDFARRTKQIEEKAAAAEAILQAGVQGGEEGGQEKGEEPQETG